MYQERVTAFIDILGFRSLVKRSEHDIGLQKSISEALSTVSPEKMRAEDIIRVRTDIIPPEELEEAKKFAALFSDSIQLEAPIAVSFFSDCIAMSADASDILATQMILDLICKLSIRIWSEHRLTLRGGITVGALHHVDGGQIFGPAMVKAYDLESAEAVYPRVLMDESCYKLFCGQPTFNAIRPLVEAAENDFYQITLGTCYHYSLTSSTWPLGDDEYYNLLYSEMINMTGQIREIESACTKAEVAEKYHWLAANCERCAGRTPNRIQPQK